MKDFLRDRHLPVTGTKSKLMSLCVWNIQLTLACSGIFLNPAIFAIAILEPARSTGMDISKQSRRLL